MAAEIKVAAKRSRRRDLRCPIDSPDRRRIMAVRLVEAIAEGVLQLMAPVRGIQRFTIEALCIQRSADHDRVQTAIESGNVGTEWLIPVPDAEVALDREVLLPLTAPGEQQLGLWMHPKRRIDLNSAAPVV